jgi:hypothetical protein
VIEKDKTENNIIAVSGANPSTGKNPRGNDDLGFSRR